MSCIIAVKAMSQATTPDIQDRLDKLQQMANWFDADPALMPLFRALFIDVVQIAPPKTTKPLSITPARRKYHRRGGSLVDHTFKSLREYGEPTTAKELAQFMASSGYEFKAKDPNIAVSKALRFLAETGKIQSKRGAHAKAPIIYWIAAAVVNVDQVPVQGEFRH